MNRFIKWFMVLFNKRDKKNEEEINREEVEGDKIGYDRFIFKKFDHRVSPNDDIYYCPRPVDLVRSKLIIFDKEEMIPSFRMRYEPLGEDYDYESEYYVAPIEIKFKRNGSISFILEKQFYLYPENKCYNDITIDKNFTYKHYDNLVVDSRERKMIITNICYYLIRVNIGIASIPNLLSRLPKEERLKFYNKFSYVTKDISSYVLFQEAFGKDLSYQDVIENNLEYFRSIVYKL